MSDYGFIITRHVNSTQTNEYWNQCVKLVNTFYPLKQIVIIDDNSNQTFVKENYKYRNLTVIQSEYPGRGELLPYIYYLKYKWFQNAVIIHDSLFIHKRIPFEQIKMPVLPFWHHKYDYENLRNILRITSSLKNNNKLINKIIKKDEFIINFKLTNTNTNNNFDLCFGCQCYIKLSFLEMLQNKYNITNLLNSISNRPDRCSLERIFGLIFCEEFPKLVQIKSLFGDIFKYPKVFSYNYDEYNNDCKQKKLKSVFIKVWTGR
jgi:hypothetical protein